MPPGKKPYSMADRKREMDERKRAKEAAQGGISTTESKSTEQSKVPASKPAARDKPSAKPMEPMDTAAEPANFP